MVLIAALLQEGKKLEAFWDWADKSSCSVAKLHLPLCYPMDCSMPGFPVLHYLPEFAQYLESVVQSNHLILCPRLLLLPSIFPNIRVFSNQLILHVRWPKYWSFRFSISPSSEYLGWISFRIYSFDLLAVQGTLRRVFSNTTVQKHQFFGTQLSL